MRESLELIKKAVEASSEFERQNTDLKRQYFISNINKFKTITSFIEESKGSFGTGYPFYALNPDLTGELPEIEEQHRYNGALRDIVMMLYSKYGEYPEWRCASCLRENSATIPDLKQICKPCPQVNDDLKPRKVLNRLPDIDMWTVCDQNDIKIVSEKLESGLANFAFSTSDVDPVKTMYDLQKIVQSLQDGEMPRLNLPMDAHIIDDATLYSLICRTPEVLDYANRHDEIPYLPIHPLSLRKTWQKDDAAYNFIWDYLQSFTPFHLDDKIKNELVNTRAEVSRKYSVDKLYEFMLTAGPESAARRYQTPELKEYFKKRIDSWREPEM